MALLDGLLHCYTPSLGPTGYRLIDRGPRRIHGVAGAGITSTAWRGDANRWCLRGANAANEQFDSCGTFPAGDRTVIIWWRAQVSLSQFVEARSAFWQGISASGQAFNLTIFHGVAGTGATISQSGDSINTTFGNDNVWNLVAVTNTGSSWAIYGDGRLLGSKTMTTNQTTTAPIVMGSPGFGTWTGEIGECAWWNRILTPTEMMKLYRDGDGAIGRMLTGQAFPRRRVSQAIAAGGATPWLYARRRSQIIGAGGVH